MRPAPIRFCVLFGILVGVGFRSWAQCPEPGVNESLYGSDAWNGYVYEGLNDFSTASFLGTLNQSAEFDELFATNQTDGGCTFQLETFSVRFKNRQSFACGLHTFTVTSNNIARLSIDGGSTFIINNASGTGQATVHLTGGIYELVLEYVHDTGSPEIHFEFDVDPGDYAGEIAGDQVICDNPADPAAFTSLSPARFCSEQPASYQWQVSFNGGSYTNIPGATSLTYNVPAGLAAGNYLYKRLATDASTSTTIESNEISVVVDIPEGDQSSFGSGSWTAYAYEGADNYTSGNYLGYFDVSALNFTEDFDAVAVNGCDLPSEGFTVRFKRVETIPTCGGYDITIEAEGGGARLYVDNVLVIDGYASVTSLTSYSANIFLSAGQHQFVLEYYNDAGANMVGFDLASTGVQGGGGVIGTDQTACGATFDPVIFTSIEDAEFCGGTITYQWQEAPSATGPWSDIPGAQSATFDEGSRGAGTYYYRRTATDGSETVFSNVIQVVISVPAGDQVTYPSGTWRAYAYDGADNFASGSYLGYFDIATLNFSEDFSAVSMQGCDLPAENFSIRFRTEQTLACGGYNISLTGDDQVKLYLDGVQLTSGYTSSYTGSVFLDGTNHRFDVEYYVAAGAKSVSFTITPTGATSSGGMIGFAQDICSSALDPPPFQSLADAGYCSGPQTYQWQIATNPGGPFTNIPGANQSTYDPPAFTPAEVGIYYYRRQYSDGVTSVNSNTLQVIVFEPIGDKTTFGDDQWIGYVYNDEADWTNNYRGYITEPANFDETFCGSDCLSPLDEGCPVRTTGFSVHFKNRMDFECGSYLITIGGDDGVQLIVDGVTIPEFDALTPHSYTTYSKIMYFDGTPDPMFLTSEVELELYYFESGGDNRVSFSATFLGPGYAGVIGGDDYSCIAGIDPGELTSVEDAISCSGPMVYQWQYSLDGLGWTDIVGANSATYDPPGPLNVTTYYRRQVTIDGYTLNSNVVTVEIDPPQGDRVTFGENAWIGYVYDKIQSGGLGTWPALDYQGYMIESTNFRQEFCGPTCTQPINGCDIFTETFSIQYRNRMAPECGYYRITLSFNDGARLFIDNTPIMGEWFGHADETQLSTDYYLDGNSHDFILEYREDMGGGGNVIGFNMEYLGAGTPASIRTDQAVCGPPYQPTMLLEDTAPVFTCTGDPSPSYQWQVSIDQANWADIPGANASSYTPPANHTFTRYYRRKDTDDSGNELFSNVVTVFFNEDDPPYTAVEFGDEEWIGHVFGGTTYTDYKGSIVRDIEFDESFCGPFCLFEIDGCDIFTEIFTIRFKARVTLTDGSYTFTVGSTSGARFSIDGGATWLIDDYASHPVYREVQNDTPVDLFAGEYEFVLEYSATFGNNRVSFSYIAAPLPVTWHSFSGYYADGQSIIEWKTASEINNDGFEVEHSTDGIHFVKIGWVEGNGNTNVPSQYQFIHHNPPHGWNYYRLKQVDYDGKFEHSRIIPVFADDLPGVEIYPNPLTDERLYLSRINTDQPVKVTLTNMWGQEPFELVQDPMLPTCFYLPHRLAPGVYHARIRLGDTVYTRKLVIE